jgi:hypothetical protein
MSDIPVVSQADASGVTQTAASSRHSYATVVELIEVGRTRKAAYSALTQSWGLINNLEASVLIGCTNFGSIDQQVQQLISSGVPASGESLRNAVVSLIDKGFMLSRSDLLSQVAQRLATTTQTPANVECLSIPTCNRPALLERALRSYLQNIREYGRAANVLVVDDSPSDAAQKENYAVLRRVSKIMRFAGKTIYVDKPHRRKFAEQLSMRSGIPRHLVGLALVGDIEGNYSTHGAARNTQILALQGRCWVTVDDDTVCSLHARSPLTGELMVGRWLPGSASGTEHHFYGSLAEALQNAHRIDVDFLGIHEGVLGKTVAELINEAGDSASILNPLALLKSTEQATPRVTVSGLGFIGDCATDWQGHYFLLDEKSVRCLMAEPARLNEYMHSRQVSVSTPRLTVWNGNILRAMTLGIDGRQRLPPFSPIDRGEEHVFGELIRTCLPDALYALHPLMLQHEPTERKQNSAWWNMQLLRPAHVINGLIQSYRCSEEDLAFESRLSRLGLYLERIGTLSPAHFVQEVLMRTWRRASAMIRVLETRSASLFSAPEFREAAEKGIEAFMAQALLQKGEHSNLCAIATEPGWRFLQAYCRDFGRVVQAWPEILQAAWSMQQEDRTEIGSVV